MWETISDGISHVKIAKITNLFEKYTSLKIWPKTLTGLILLALTVYTII